MSKPKKPMPSTRRLHCSNPECGWSGKRAVTGSSPKKLGINMDPCPLCDSSVVLGSGRRGPAARPEERRVELRVWVLPATMEKLEGSGGVATKEGALVLDNWASRR